MAPKAMKFNQHDVFLQVHADLKKRDALGWHLHGKPLDARDTRDWLREAYEELLDMTVYMKAELIRREAILSNAPFAPPVHGASNGTTRQKRA